jgi:ArsR family transcriptional regulator
MASTTIANKPAESEAQKGVGDVLRVLGDPTRLRIFRLLRAGEACVCEMAAELELAENLVSHHLRALREIGLVHDRRDPSDARWVYYHLSTPALGRIRAELGALFDPFTLGVRTPTCGPAALIQVGASGAERAPEMCCTR